MFISRLLLVLFTSLPVAAHEMRPALVRLVQLDATTWEMVFKQPQVAGRFMGLRAETGCEIAEESAIAGDTALQETLTLACPADGPESVTVAGIERTLVDAMVTVSRLDGSEASYVLNASTPTVLLTSDTPTVPVYLVLGVEHLVFGIDHVLFVIILLYLVQGWGNLIKVITSFTVAHSLTLALSAFAVVTVPGPPVEALIALSIVLLAAEALQPHESLLAKYPWLVTFVFGLLHGLGFAGALADIGLPEGQAVGALFLFNVGIELGQIAIVAAALLLVAAAKRTVPDIPGWVPAAPVYAIGGLASFWLIERTLIVAGLAA